MLIVSPVFNQSLTNIRPEVMICLKQSYHMADAASVIVFKTIAANHQRHRVMTQYSWDYACIT